MLTLSSVAVIMAACSSSTTAGSGTTSVAKILPVKAYAAPSNLIGFSQIAPNNTAWILSGTAAAKTIQSINLNTGSLSAPVGVSSSASSIALTPSGVIAIGWATPNAGAVQLFSVSNPSVVLATIPVAAPVIRVEPVSNGAALYVLERLNGAVSVQVVSIQAQKVVPVGTGNISIPLPGDTLGMVPSVDGNSIYIVEASGQAEHISMQTGNVEASFPVGLSAKDVTLSTNGQTIYVLKCPGSICNVAEFDAYGYVIIGNPLPAPLNTVQIQISPDDSTIWDAVGSPIYGNVQAFSLTSS